MALLEFPPLEQYDLVALVYAGAVLDLVPQGVQAPPAPHDHGELVGGLVVADDPHVYPDLGVPDEPLVQGTLSDGDGHGMELGERGEE